MIKGCKGSVFLNPNCQQKARAKLLSSKLSFFDSVLSTLWEFFCQKNHPSNKQCSVCVFVEVTSSSLSSWDFSQQKKKKDKNYCISFPKKILLFSFLIHWVSICRHLPTFQGLNAHACSLRVPDSLRQPLWHTVPSQTGVFTTHPSVIELWLEPLSGRGFCSQCRNTLTKGPTVNMGAF